MYVMAASQYQKSATSHREEIHWNSFRSAVASIQNRLVHGLDNRGLDAKNTTKDQAETQTPRFDFSGIDKIDAGEYSDMNSNTNMISPLNEDTNISQTAASRVASEALSIAEQQISQMKLQLALTEAERDELEFELMQSKNDVGD